MLWERPSVSSVIRDSHVLKPGMVAKTVTRYHWTFGKPPPLYIRKGSHCLGRECMRKSGNHGLEFSKLKYGLPSSYLDKIWLTTILFFCYLFWFSEAKNMYILELWALFCVRTSGLSATLMACYRFPLWAPCFAQRFEILVQLKKKEKKKEEDTVDFACFIYLSLCIVNV